MSLMDDLGLTYCDFVTQYKMLFQDKNNYWLYCREEENIKLCRCLDLKELNIGMLWLNDDKDTNTRLEGYVIDINDSRSTENRKEYPKVAWCNFYNSPVLIRDIDNKKSEDSSSNSTQYDPIKYNHAKYKFLFILLYIYRANINMCRSSVIEFYFANNTNAFYKYMEKLGHELGKGSVDENNLKKHIRIMKKVFHLYTDRQARFDLFRENDEYRDDIYDGISSYGFCQKIGNSPIDLSKLKKKLDKECLTPFIDTGFIIESKTIQHVYNIAIKINDLYNMDHFRDCFNDIYASMEYIIINTKRAGEKPIKDNMDKLAKVIQRDLH